MRQSVVEVPPSPSLDCQLHFVGDRHVRVDHELQELRQEAERHEAEMIDAQKTNKVLKRTIEDLERQLGEAESKVAELTKLQGKENWMAKHESESVDDLRKRNSTLMQELKAANQKLEVR